MSVSPNHDQSESIGSTPSTTVAVRGNPRLAHREWQRLLLLGLLIILQLAGALLVPMGLESRFSYWDYVGMVALGWSIAPPTLLAIWAVCGTQRVAARYPAALCLLGMFSLTLLYCVVRNEGAASNEMWLFLAAWPLTFAIVQVPLWLLTWFYRWRLTLALSHEKFLATPTSQFSLRALLGWTVAAAMLLAAGRALMPQELPDTELISKQLADLGAFAFCLAVAGLPFVALAWMILASGRRPWLRFALGLVVVVCVASGFAIISFMNGPESGELAALEAGLLVNGLLTFIVLADCGYRFERGPRAKGGDDGPPQAIDSNVHICSTRRYVVGLLSLILIGAGMACALTHRLKEWRQVDLRAWWQLHGFHADFDNDGQVSQLIAHPDDFKLTDTILLKMAELPVLELLDLSRMTMDEKQLSLLAPLSNLRELRLRRGEFGDAGLAHVGRLANLEILDLAKATVRDAHLCLIAPLNNLRGLRLTNCEITDAGLAQLSQLTPLRGLILVNTRVTDAGLAHLTALPNLSVIDLRTTDVTDDGLTVLSRLSALSAIDVSQTAVSDTGAAEFRRIRPDVELQYGACDADLDIDEKVTSKRLHLRGRKLEDRRVLTLTDASLTSVAKHVELEVLDLRETAITDRGLLVLDELHGLKLMDLRGTTVTEQAVILLSNALPECKILATE